VLEVGGGHGQLTSALLAAGHRVCVHGSHGSCHDRLRKRGVTVDFVTSSLWQLPFAEHSFDLVVAIRLLAHVEDCPSLLAELARVSRGLVLLDFPVRGAAHRMAPWLFRAKRAVEGNTRPYFDYPVSEVEQALDGVGLRVLGVHRQLAFPMALHRALKRPGLSRRLESAADRIGLTGAVGSPVLILAGHSDPKPSH